MFNEWKVRLKEIKLESDYRPHFAKLQAGTDEYLSLESEYAHFRTELQDERRLLYQMKLLKNARRLFLPIPGYTQKSGNWETSHVLHGQLLLTDSAIKQLRNEIREELKSRREMALGWVAPLSGIIGTILGVLLGYFLK